MRPPSPHLGAGRLGALQSLPPPPNFLPLSEPKAPTAGPRPERRRHGGRRCFPPSLSPALCFHQPWLLSLPASPAHSLPCDRPAPAHPAGPSSSPPPPCKARCIRERRRSPLRCSPLRCSPRRFPPTCATRSRTRSARARLARPGAEGQLRVTSPRRLSLAPVLSARTTNKQPSSLPLGAPPPDGAVSPQLSSPPLPPALLEGNGRGKRTGRGAPNRHQMRQPPTQEPSAPPRGSTDRWPSSAAQS